MKKSIGLTADISTFNTTLPQTRHLNYFMGTNPRRYASGGEVSQGIPNYPNPNVTNGFLPMALGFSPGGEVNEKDSVTKVYDFFFGYFKNVLGMDDNEAKEKTEETINNSTEKEIEDIVQKIPSGPSQEVFDREEEIKGLKTPDGLNLTIPAGTSTLTPPIQNQNQTPGFPPPPPPGLMPGGITTVEPEKEKKYKWADLNKDGVIDKKDLEIARNTPGLGWAIKLIEGIIGGFDDSEEGETPEKIVPETPEIVPEKPKIVPEKEPIIKDGGITGSGRGTDLGGMLETQRRKADTLTEEDQNTLKKGSQIAAGEDTSGGITDKKDVPAWALPMMSAGFAMMASKSPYFLQALGEGGQKGLETYSGIKEAESKKELDKAQIAGLEARAAYDRGEGRNTNKPTIINDSEGRRVYAIFDREKNQYVPIESASGGPQYAVRSMIEIDEYLSGIHLNWSSMTEIQKQELRDAQIALDMGIAKTNVTSSVTEEKNEPGFLDKIIKGVKEGVTTAKDGGIVSLRR